MQAEVPYWLIEGQVICNRYEGRFTVTMFEENAAKVLALLDNTTHEQVHFIVDVRAVEGNDFSALGMMGNQMMRALATHPRSAYQVFVVGDNSVHRFFLKLFSGLKREMKVCDSCAEAVEVLETLVDVPADVREALYSS